MLQDFRSWQWEKSSEGDAWNFSAWAGLEREATRAQCMRVPLPGNVAKSLDNLHVPVLFIAVLGGIAIGTRLHAARVRGNPLGLR
jgi:hypothetical protein